MLAIMQNNHAIGHDEGSQGGAIGRIVRMFSDDGETPAAGGARTGDDAVLDKLRDFIVSNDLGVTHSTLICAHDFVTRNNLSLVRKVREREESGKPITRLWLESQMPRRSGQDGAQKLDRVIAHLERNVETLSDAASQACSATRSYNDRLNENHRQLESAGAQGMEPVIGLVRQMIDNTRVLEERLKETEAESRAMRDDLRKARQLADEDHLTGLPNRRAFEKRFREAIAERPEGSGLVVGFCDIDLFKQVNDQHGHDTGDRVLRLVARHLAQATGNNCFVARHGGEEFAVLFEGMGLEQAQTQLDEARTQLASRELKDRRTARMVGPVTFSAGLAAYDETGEPGDTLKRADQALYSAKQQGRNRVVLATVGAG